MTHSTPPRLKIDVGSDVPESILSQLVEERVKAEMSAAAKSLRYNGPRTLEHIAKQSRDESPGHWPISATTRQIPSTTQRIHCSTF